MRGRTIGSSMDRNIRASIFPMYIKLMVVIYQRYRHIQKIDRFPSYFKGKLNRGVTTIDDHRT